MSARPSTKKALKKYAGSRASRVKDQQALLNKVSRELKKQNYTSARALDLIDDVPRPALTRMVPRGFVGGRGDAKFLDTAVAVYALNTTGSITHISPVPQGTTVNQREGKAFRCTSVNVRGQCFNNTTSALNAVAMYLVWDYQPNKVLPAITAIFDTVNAYSFPSRENNERFKVIKKFYTSLIGVFSAPTNGQMAEPIDEYVRLPEDCNVLCTSADTTGAIGNTIQGALYWITMGNNAAGTADADCEVGFRLNFTDKVT